MESVALKVGDRVRRKKYGVSSRPSPIRFVTAVSDDGTRVAIASKPDGKPQSSRWYEARTVHLVEATPSPAAQDH